MRADAICFVLAVGLSGVTQASAQGSPSATPATSVLASDTTQVDRPLPDGSELVRSMVDRQRSFEEAMDSYTYDLVRTEEHLDSKDRVKKRHLRRYEVFFVQGGSAHKLVEDDGRPLTPSEQEKEERRVRKKAEEAARRKKERTRDSEDDLKISKVLARFDFTSLSRAIVDGRTTVLVEFRAQPGKRDIDQDNVLRALRGRLWIDEEERVVLRAEFGSAQGIKIGGGLLASISSFDVKMEIGRVDQIWLPRRTEAFVAGRLLLLKKLRQRVVDEYSNFRRFEVTTEEHLIGAER